MVGQWGDGQAKTRQAGHEVLIAGLKLLKIAQ